MTGLAMFARFFNVVSTRGLVGFIGLLLLFGAGPHSVCSAAQTDASSTTTDVGVGSQYDDTHVYVSHGDLTQFVESFVSTFGGRATKQLVLTITPTPSSTLWQGASSPEGSISGFDFQTQLPYGFGYERTGYLVTNMDTAVRAAVTDGADIIVAPFADAIGRDAIIEWPGGVMMQLYWHTIAAHDPPFTTVPENRVYLSPVKADEFVRDFIKFSHGHIVSDVKDAPGIEIGLPSTTYRRIRISSIFGKVVVLVTDGHLPYPYGIENTGYQVANLQETLGKAEASGATVLVAPFTSGGRESSIVQFPGGYIAEIHSDL